MKRFTFKDLCRSLEKNPSLSENADAVKTLMGSVSAILGNAGSGNIIGFIRAISEKDKLIDLGKLVLQKILDKKSSDYVTRIDQMKEAYGLICFTAFFDSLDHVLPDDIRKSINLTLKEKEAIFQESAAGEKEDLPAYIKEAARHPDLYEDRKKQRSIDISIIFPDIVYSSARVDKELRTLYEVMADFVFEFVGRLSFQEHAGEKDVRIFGEGMQELPQMALKQFHEQYLYLCSHFEEFYVFTQMEREKEREIENTEQYHTLFSCLRGIDDKIDISLEKLTELITTLPAREKKDKVRDIAANLTNTYRRSIEKPVVESQGKDEKLVYPLVSEAFIPQRYKLLRYTGQEKLDLADTWDEFDPQRDMTSFWTKYYLDPGSVENILLILGEPGIGKSLLTRVLCARMSSEQSVFIRIPLREHDMEDKIESIVLRQLSQDGDLSEDISKFKWFAEEFPDNPITLVFDGYDEVLQATGEVYRRLLQEMRDFQQSCYERGRPVRIIVTSRETLIDKADIPSGALVMKLLEFDDDQKAEWIDIWNEHNHDILEEEGLEDFRLPEKNEDAEKLSGQPLLLLMLAIYDADFELKTNSLTKQSGQDQTFNRSMLYDELLRRFVRRELRKGPKGEESAFDEADGSGQKKMVDEEMKKLGIAALGMFVREKLSLTADELDHDLEYMKAKSAHYSMSNKSMLKNAEIVFGSFFFIHHSEMRTGKNKKDATYEFMHKTFYEFLVADLVLSYLIEAADKNPESPDSFSQQYYAALNGACLCTEPEIIRMTAEWKDAKITACTAERPKLRNELPRIMKDIFERHACMIRECTLAPSTSEWWNGSPAEAGSGRSFPETCAVYLINLLTMRILICGECEVDAKLWSFVAQYFKLNAPVSKKTEAEEVKSKDGIPNLEIPLSEEVILKFMALFEIGKEKDCVILRQRQNDSINAQNDLIDARAEVFDFLQDDTTRMIYKLHDANMDRDLKQKYRTDLIERGADLNFESDAKRLKSLIDSDIDYQNITFIRSIGRLIGRCFDEMCTGKKDEDLVLDCLMRIREIIGKIPHSAPIIVKQAIYDRRKYWTRYIDRILCNYTKDISDVFLDILKMIGDNIERMIPGTYILRIMETPDSYPLDLVCKILDSIFEHNYYYRNIYSAAVREINDNNIFEKWFQVYKDGSPKQLTEILRIFGVYFRSPIPEYVFKEIPLKWSEYLANNPKELPGLLHIYLQLGRFNEVREFFKQKNNYIANRLIRRKEKIGTRLLIDEFLKIAEQVCADKRFLRGILPRLSARDYQRYPRVFMKGFYYALSGEMDLQDITSLADVFLRIYERNLFHYSNESVSLLYYLTKSKRIIEQINVKDFNKACFCNLENYMSILDKSVSAAAHALQIWFDCEKLIQKNQFSKLFDQDIRLRFCAEKCFDKALITRNPADEDALIDLLRSMNSDMKRSLHNYFNGKTIYFRQYSKPLAQELARIYNWPENNDKRRNEVTK